MLKKFDTWSESGLLNLIFAILLGILVVIDMIYKGTDGISNSTVCTEIAFWANIIIFESRISRYKEKYHAEH